AGSPPRSAPRTGRSGLRPRRRGRGFPLAVVLGDVVGPKAPVEHVPDAGDTDAVRENLLVPGRREQALYDLLNEDQTGVTGPIGPALPGEKDQHARRDFRRHPVDPAENADVFGLVLGPCGVEVVVKVAVEVVGVHPGGVLIGHGVTAAVVVFPDLVIVADQDALSLVPPPCSPNEKVHVQMRQVVSIGWRNRIRPRESAPSLSSPAISSTRARPGGRAPVASSLISRPSRVMLAPRCMISCS